MRLCSTKEQYAELYKWLAKNHASILRYFLGFESDDSPFCVLPKSSVIYLKRKCPIQWVQEKIKEVK
jgi:hypothetical protein